MPGKVKYSNLTEKERMKFLGDFYDMVASLDGRAEAKKFFKDLLTLSETVMISRRIQVAKLLLQGRTYDEIKIELKVGGSTINQVDRWLNNGFGGYKTVIKKHSKKKKEKIEMSDADTPFTLQNLKRKYPYHFLLLSLLDKNK